MTIALLGTPLGGNTGSAASTTITNSVPTSAQGVTNANTIGYWTIYGTATSIAAIPTPTGWAPVTGTAQLAGTVLRSATFFRYASAEPASYTLSGLTSGRYCSLMRFYSGVDGTTDQDVAATNLIGTTTASPPSITPTTSGAWIDAVNGVNTASGTTTTTWTSSNMTKDLDSTSVVTSNTNAAGGLAHVAWTSGAFAPNLTQATSTSSRDIGITMALRPAAAVASLPELVMAPRTY